ncbi:MAG: host-nuclease inhibitor Gam family protein [Campylobacter sp.]|nr:host-nuclease inhibitor Gam family protein [Campylobacter sp.]
MKILSFSDVDSGLKRLCELEVAINNINGDITLKCNEIKEARKSEIERLDSERKYIEQQITAFCEDNKAEFAEKRSKDFTFGKIGYKLSKSVSLPRLKEKVEKLVSALKSYKLDHCISYTETINKDEIVELGDAELVKLGLKRVVKDNFRIETKIENLESANV